MRLIDLFFKGGETVRGFDRAGYGPRDLNTNDALGGQTYWATTAEIRFPIPFVPDDLGISGAVFADAGSLFGPGAGAKNARRAADWCYDYARRQASAWPTARRSAPRSARA